MATVFALDTLALVQAAGLATPLLRTYQEHENGWDGDVDQALLPVGSARLSRQSIHTDSVALEHLAGHRFAGPRLVAARRAAQVLFAAAVEVRALTALGAGRTVREGSLRVVELVPAGCQFLLVAGNDTGGPAALPGSHPLQIGGWEGTGCGYLELSVVSGQPGPRAQLSAGESKPAAPRRRTTSDLMTTAYRAVARAQERHENEALRTISRQFGARWRREGLPRALAFSLAKAKLKTPEAKAGKEAFAHRVLLGVLVPGASADATEACRPLLTGAPPLPDLEEAWLWLRRLVDAPDQSERDTLEPSAHDSEMRAG
jgi:hypothetical protein